MGTVFSLHIAPPGVPTDTFEQVLAWLHWVDATFSTYRHSSDINRYDRGEVDLADCAPEVGEILNRCTELETVTSGYFSARLAGRLDPSGLVKGWAIERASDLLAAAGATNHMINGGGDVQCRGTPGDRRPWRIGVTDPAHHDRVSAVASGFDFAVATSGSTERGSHILDPHTGRPSAGLHSVTIIGPRVALADAYATAAFAMGTACYDWLEQLSGHDALVITKDGTSWSTAGFRRYRDE